MSFALFEGLLREVRRNAVVIALFGKAYSSKVIFTII